MDSHGAGGHSHVVIDPKIASTRRGMQAIFASLALLGATAALQTVVSILSGSVALLADTLHNFGDAATAIPLWIAFTLLRRKPSPRFSYGYGRVEDLAGLAIVLTILASAAVAGYEALDRLLQPRPVEHLWAVAAASLVGFAGNAWVAVIRTRAGQAIGSAALVADGQHARADALTSLGVLLGVAGVALGFPLADPLVGLLITLAILRIVWDSGKTILTRMLDGVEPELLDEVRHAAEHVEGVREVTEVRLRWLGHWLHAEVNLALDPSLTLAEAHAIAVEARHQLLHHLPFLSNAVIHPDPGGASGELHHGIAEHAHDEWPAHSHR